MDRQGFRRPGHSAYFADPLVDLRYLSRYDLLAAGLQAGLLVVTGATILLYLGKRTGNRTANLFFALLLTAFGLCVADLILEHLAVTALHPRLHYLPIWLTWTIGPSWFFYVKLSLFPAYRLRRTDLKHAVFPVSQVLYYLYCLLTGADGLRRPFLFGFAASTFEEFIFMASILGYLMAAYRYLRFRTREIGPREERWDYWWVRQLRHIQRVLVVLLVFNFGFVVYNFVVAQSSGVGVLHLRGFYASSSLSFGLILLYLLRGVAHRQHFSAMVPLKVLTQVSPEPAERLRTLMLVGRGFRDPNAHEVRAARSIGVEPRGLTALVPELGSPTWSAYLRRLRLAEVARLREQGVALGLAILDAGFPSRAEGLRALRGR